MKLLIPDIKVTERGLESRVFFTSEIDEKPNDMVTAEELLGFTMYKEEYSFIILVSFSICKPSLIWCLLNNPEFHQQRDPSDKTMSWNVYGDYMEIYRTKKEKITICSYEKKFLQDYTDAETAKRLMLTDTYFKPTCTQTAKAEFMECVTGCKNEFINRYKFDKIFPQPEEKEFITWKKTKESVKAFMYLKKAGNYKDVYSYDIRASFPSELYNSLFPQGKGTRGLIEVPVKHWYIAKIRVYRCIPIVYDFFGLFDKFIENQRQPFNTYLTKDMLECLEEFYDVEYAIQFKYSYKMQKSIFDKFIEDNIYTPDKPIRKYNKAKNNTLIGSFGANDQYPVYEYMIGGDKKNRVNATITYETKDKKAFYPLYLYVNGSAKVKICRLLQSNWEHIIYANTDGFVSDAPIEMDLMFNSRYSDLVGKVELRQYYLEFAVKEISNYSAIFANEDGEIMQDIRLSGRRIMEPPTHQQFIDGGFETLLLQQSDYGFIKPVVFVEQSLKYYQLIEERDRK